ncbi:MAG: peptidylprolyl isomerase [Bryobacteraceae bacterium]|jgi:peptidyl-prolyl cis-trans isomerase D
MFDLFRLGNREKLKKFGMVALLLMVSASMLLYLVPNYDRSSGSGDVVVAQIGKETLTETEVRHTIQNLTKGRQLPAEVLPNYVPEMIDQIIAERAMAYEADRLGLQVTDQDVADALRQMYAGLFPDGKFVGKDVYAAMLAQQGTTIEQFESDMKRDMLIARLRQVALEGTIVTPLEIENEYRKKNELLKIQFVKMPVDKFKKEAEPTEEQVAAYYKTNLSRFTVPEKKNLVILVADQAKIEASLNPSDAELMTAYNQNLSNFRMPERVQARHILLMTQGKPASDEPKVKAKAEDILKQLRAGADFAEMAKKNSEDTGSGAKGGDLGWVTRGQMVPEFEKATFSLKPGVISDLVKTQYGYHIIQVQAHEDARVKPFAEVKDELSKQWKQMLAGQKMQQVEDTAQAALQKDPTHAEKVAADLGMQLVRADGAEPGKALPEVGSNSDFDQSIATLKKGEVSQVVPLGASKLALAEVMDIIPARSATFEEAKGQIRQFLSGQNLNILLQERAKQLVAAAKASGDLAKAAKAVGLEAKTPEPFKRQATVEGFGSAAYIDDAFTKPDGTIMNPIPMPDATVIVKLMEHVPADIGQLAEQRDKIREDLKVQKARSRGNLFQGGLVDELVRQGRVKLHQNVINRIITSFRG